MKTIYTIEIPTIAGNKKILVNLLDNIHIDQTIDVLTVFDVFKLNPTEEEVIDEMIYSMGLDVYRLSKYPLINEIESSNIYLSKKIEHRKYGINYLGVIKAKYEKLVNSERKLNENALLESITKYFEMLCSAMSNGIRIKTIAIPLINTRIREISNDLILIPFIRECILFLIKNSEVEEILFIEKDIEEVNKFVDKLNKSYLLTYFIKLPVYKRFIISDKHNSVYIAHDAKNIDLVEILKQKLNDENFIVRLPIRNEEKKDNLILQIINSDNCIVICDENSSTSYDLLNEIDLASYMLKNKIKFIILKKDSSKIDLPFMYYFAESQIIDINFSSVDEYFGEIVYILDNNPKAVESREDYFSRGRLPSYKPEINRSEKAMPKTHKDVKVPEWLLKRFYDSNEQNSQKNDSNIHFCPFCGSQVKDSHIYCSCCGYILKDEEEYKRVKLSEVQFAAIIPETFHLNRYLMIDLIMFEEIYKKIVEEKIASKDYKVKEVRSGVHEIKHNAMVKVKLSSPDLNISEEDTQKWIGKYSIFTFPIQIDKDINKKEILFIASIYFDDIVATKLKFIIKKDEAKGKFLDIERNDITSAFISYASQDRTTVTKIIQGMKSARPDLDIFFDVDSLRTGENWEERIKKEIEKRDVLYLCWSKYAKESKFVTMEWKHALENKGIEAIEPIPLVSPSECAPPEELKSKHFNDKILYYR